MKYYLILLFLFYLHLGFAQEVVYEVDVELRENSFVITNTAIDMIANENYASAARILEKVIEDDPSFHSAYMNYYRAGSQVDEKKEKVIQVLRKGLEIFKEDDEMAYYLGNLLQKENRYDEAIVAYTEAIAYSKVNGEDFPLVWAYYFNRGNCFLKTNHHSKAIPDYDYALKLSPKNSDVMTNRGFCYYKIDKKSAACNDWHEALQLGNKVTERYIQSFCQ
jgi:tetratricopeptide (TPR) repeat protein